METNRLSQQSEPPTEPKTVASDSTNLQYLHKGLQKKGLINLDYDSFASKYDNEKAQEYLYKGLQKKGLFKSDFNQFKTLYFPSVVGKPLINNSNTESNQDDVIETQAKLNVLNSTLKDSELNSKAAEQALQNVITFTPTIASGSTAVANIEPKEEVEGDGFWTDAWQGFQRGVYYDPTINTLYGAKDLAEKLSNIPGIGGSFGNSAALQANLKAFNLWGDNKVEELQKEAPELEGTTTEKFFNVVGNIVPTLVGVAAAPVTGGASAGVAVSGIYGAQAYGNGLREYDEYIKETGEEANELERQAVGVGYATMEIATEYIPMDKALKGAKSTAFKWAIRKGNKAQLEMAKDLGEKVVHLVGDNFNDLAGAGLRSAFVEAPTEGASQLGQNIIDIAYRKDTDLTLDNLSDGVGESALYGGLAGTAIGPLATIAESKIKENTYNDIANELERNRAFQANERIVEANENTEWTDIDAPATVDFPSTDLPLDQQINSLNYQRNRINQTIANRKKANVSTSDHEQILEVINKEIERLEKDFSQSQKSYSVGDGVKQKYQASQKAEGKKDSIMLPKGEVINGSYKIVEAEDIAPSHDEFSFKKTAGFPVDENGKTVNDRDYENDPHAKNTVIDYASDFTRQAVQDVPVVSEDGIVLSGNNRTMSRRRAGKSGRDTDYLEGLKQNLESRGFKDVDLSKFKMPMLVFEQAGPVDYTTQNFAKFNAQDKKSKSTIDKAITAGKSLTETQRGAIYDNLAEYEDIADFYQSAPAQRNLLTDLVKRGVLQQEQLAEMTDTNGTLSTVGKDWFETIALGSVLNEQSLRQLDSSGLKSIRRKTLKALPEIGKIRAMGDYSIINNIEHAIDFIADSNKRGIKTNDALQQTSLLDKGIDITDPITLASIYALEDKGGSSKIKSMLNHYVNQASGPSHGEMDMIDGLKSPQKVREDFSNYLQKSDLLDDRQKSVLDYVRSTPGANVDPEVDTRSLLTEQETAQQAEEGEPIEQKPNNSGSLAFNPTNFEGQELASFSDKASQKRRQGIAHDFTQEVKKAPESMANLSEKIRERIDNAVVRLGRIKNHRAAGIFNRASGVVRLRTPHDYETLVHELAHKLQFTKGPVDTFVKQNKKALSPFAYTGARKGSEASEGFAELFRYWMGNHSIETDAEASYLVGQMKKVLKKVDPSLVEDLEQLREDYKSYLGQSSLDTARGIVKTGVKEDGVLSKLKTQKEEVLSDYGYSVFDKTYESIIDEKHGVKKAVDILNNNYARNNGRGIKLKASKDPYILLRLAEGAEGGAFVQYEHGVIPFNKATPDGPSIKEAIQLAGKDAPLTKDVIPDFGAYLAMRRARAEYENFNNGLIKNRPISMSEADVAQAITDFEKRYPNFTDAAELVYTFNKKYLRRIYDASLITQDEYNEHLKRVDYVPLNRILPKEGQTIRLSGKKDNSSGVFKRFGGSELEIQSPLEAMAKNMASYEGRIAQNNVIKAFADLAETSGINSGFIAEKISAYDVQIESKDIKEDVALALESTKDADTADVLIDVLNRMDELPKDIKLNVVNQRLTNTKGEPILFYYEKGKRKALRLGDGDLGKSVYDAIAGLNKTQQNLLVDIAAPIAMVFRGGVTMSPSFMVANYFRDQLSAWVLTDSNYNPITDGAKGAKSRIKKDEYYQRYLGATGWGTTNMSTLSSAAINKQIKRATQDGISIKTVGLHALAEGLDISESSTRIGVFQNKYDALIEKGYTEKEATIEAAFEARDLLDFGRKGSAMHGATRVIPFLNANLQGLDKAVRVMSADGNIKQAIAPYAKFVKGLPLSEREQLQLNYAKAAWLKVGALSLVGLMIHDLYSDDEEYQSFDYGIKSTHWLFKLNGEWVALPKPYELAITGNMMQAVYDRVKYDDSTATDDFLTSTKHILTVPYRPTFFTPMLEHWANKSFYNDMPIVHDGIKNLEPRNQITNYTSDLAISIGEHTGLSPVVIDHYMKAYGGTIVRRALDMTKHKNEHDPEAPIYDVPFLSRFVRSPYRGSKAEREFWNLVTTDEGQAVVAKTQYKAYMENNEPEQADSYLKKKPLWIQDYVQFNEARKINPDLGKHPLDNAREFARTISRIRKNIREDTRLKPRIKKDADLLLDAINTDMMRNTLHDIEHPSFANRSRVNFQDKLDKLYNLSDFSLYVNELEDARVKYNIKLEADR